MPWASTSKMCALLTATLFSAAISATSEVRASETERQHREWMRKIQAAGGTMSAVADGARLGLRREADIRQLLRCQIFQSQDEALFATIDGCGPERL